jgi:hypothetical protein
MPSSRRLGLVGFLAALLMLVGAAAAQPANNAEQVIFSGTGSGTFNSVNQGFGFWIWCQNSNPAGQYSGVCQGAMYFYGLGITKHVFGEVSEIGTNTDGSDRYRMDVTNGTNVSCTLKNWSGGKGPHNNVSVWCSSPSGSGSSNNAVVNATGPS